MYRACDPPSGSKGEKVLIEKRAKSDIRTITVKIRKTEDLMRERSPTEGTVEVRRRTRQTGEGSRVLRDEEGKRGSKVRTPRGREAEVKVPATAGAEVTAEAQRGKMKLIRSKERDMTMRDQVDRGRMRKEKNMRDLHASVTMKVR